MRVVGMPLALYPAALFVCVTLAVGAQQQVIGTSGLSGIVVDSLDGPVALAQVSVVDGNNGSISNEDGHFRIMSLLARKTLFEARRIGYEPVYFEVDIPSASIVEVRIRLRESPRVLTPVSVEDVRDPLRRFGFYDRMVAGHGNFVTPERIAMMRPVRATDAFANIPNLVVDRRGNRTRIVTANYKCEYALVVDNVLVGEPGSRIRTTSPDDAVSASELYAIEVYPRNRGLPPQFLGMSHEEGCGTVIIWTKGMLPR